MESASGLVRQYRIQSTLLASCCKSCDLLHASHVILLLIWPDHMIHKAVSTGWPRG